MMRDALSILFGDEGVTLTMTFIEVEIKTMQWGDINILDERVYRKTHRVRNADLRHVLWLLTLPKDRWAKSMESVRVTFPISKRAWERKKDGVDGWVT